MSAPPGRKDGKRWRTSPGPELRAGGGERHGLEVTGANVKKQKRFQPRGGGGGVGPDTAGTAPEVEEAIEQRDKALRKKDEEIGRLRQEIDALRGRGQEQWIAAYRPCR